MTQHDTARHSTAWHSTAHHAASVMLQSAMQPRTLAGDLIFVVMAGALWPVLAHDATAGQ